MAVGSLDDRITPKKNPCSVLLQCNYATQAANLRPITIYSNWYRWWASTWGKSSVIKTWRAQALPPNIIGGAESRSTESIGSQIRDDLQHYGFMASLDYSQCYDNVHPSLATTALRQLGLPKGLCEVLHAQWTHQKRFLTWNNHVYPVPLQSYQSIPQGDPMSPLALMTQTVEKIRENRFQHCGSRRYVPHGFQYHVFAKPRRGKPKGALSAH